jgi:hypothetical protein
MPDRVCECCRWWRDGWCWLGCMPICAEGTCGEWLEPRCPKCDGAISGTASEAPYCTNCGYGLLGPLWDGV